MTHTDTDSAVNAGDEDLTAAIQALTGASVLVIGDVMLDRYVQGTVARVSPEAPIPVLSVDSRSTALGGAGNVARNLSDLGVRVALVAPIGGDDAGRELLEMLQAVEGLTPRLHALADRPTTVKTRFLAAGQQLLRADEESASSVPASAAEEILNAFRVELPACRAVILSDYGKGCLSDAVLRGVMDACAAAGIPVLVDPKGRDFSRYAGAAVVTPNRAELSLATGMPTGDDAEITGAGQTVIRECCVEAVLATRSEQGMTLVRGDGAFHVPAQAREVFDVVGAGDTVIALLAAGLASGASFETAVRLANLGGGVVVSKIGTASVHPQELLAAMHGAAWHEGERNVLTGDAAAERVGRWKRDGHSVGFTNGCFDLLHPGHIHLLRQSRGQCDRLIVGLNSDESVERLKGPDRPIQNEVARATVLASLEFVDAVVVFGEDTPLDLIKTLQPDVLVKGSDYTRETVVGAREVESWGGRVYLADLLNGHSTTKTVSKLQAS